MTTREIGRVTIAEALELTALVARKQPRRYGRFAARWLCLYLEENEKRLDGRDEPRRTEAARSQDLRGAEGRALADQVHDHDAGQDRQAARREEEALTGQEHRRGRMRDHPLGQGADDQQEDREREHGEKRDACGA